MRSYQYGGMSYANPHAVRSCHIASALCDCGLKNKLTISEFAALP